jgi:hypothetical protein
LKHSACSLVHIGQLPLEIKQALLRELASELGFILHPVTHTLADFQRPLISLTLADVQRAEPAKRWQLSRGDQEAGTKGELNQNGID